MQLVANAGSHQAVPRLVEGHFVDTLAVAVESVQYRRPLICQFAPFDRLAAPEAANLARPFARPAATFALECLNERQVVLKQVATAERWGLVGYLMSSH
ncbi:unannotated protein [freshwater metagenome]|uniref:Unannotated protein n=1 Tax=freshwater metagenome TaxID=449393 RepID=A0A6J7RIN4_9ZZZZ